ncbi:ABC transporter substrate-binding protein [Actinomycetospora atypica]|uniref:ABC transporter substrate-binding protein n=1 Tax=Actinomycetospora atypica TaxID=1290095 RepID=A0ABV9YVX2_9PSEU
MTRTARCAPVLLAALLVLTGCFSGGGGTAAAGDQRLRVALSFAPKAGLTPDANEAVLATRLGATEPLTTVVDGEPRPVLATAWTPTGPTSWRFTLRSGVTFHDGTPLTPAAVANSLNRAAAATPGPRALTTLKRSGTPLTAVPDGADAVVVTTPVPDPVLPARLASPELVVLADRAYADPVRPAPTRAGTGPFVLTAVQGSTGATFDRNPTYWGGPVAAAGVDARFLTDGAARANGIRAGELDVADAIPVSQAASIAAPAQVLAVPLPRSVSLHLDMRSPVFADPGRRAAVRDALRPLDVAGTIYEGRADAAAALFGPATPWAAGRPPRTDTPATPPAGAVVRLATQSNRPELPEIASADADALRRAGFTVEVTVLDTSALEPRLGTGAFDAVVVSRSQQLNTSDPVSYLASDFGCTGGYNWSRYCDPATDAILAQGATSSDLGARRQAALAAEARVLSADAVVPQIAERARLGVGAGVTGVAQDPTELTLITATTARS